MDNNGEEKKQIKGDEMLSIEMTVAQADLIIGVFSQAPLQLSYKDTDSIIQTIATQTREQINEIQKGEGDE